METSLVLDSKAKKLNLVFKKKYVHHSDTVLAVRGRLDTTNATALVDAKIDKFVYVGSLSNNPDEVYQPDTRLRLGLGVQASTASDEVVFSASAKKKLLLRRSVHELRNKTVLTGYTQAVAKANYDYNPRNDRWSGMASASVSHAMFRFTDDQDLRITAGIAAPLSNTGIGQAEAYLRLQENCWTLTLDRHGGWNVRYDL